MVIVHEKDPTTPPSKLALKPQKSPIGQISYIFKIAGLGLILFVFQPLAQQENCKAHKIGQFCHQDQPSICLCSKVRDRAMTAFRLAPKWSTTKPNEQKLRKWDIHENDLQ